MSVNKSIRIHRKEKNLSTYELAKKIGVSQSCVVRYENGTISFVPVPVLEKMSEVFDCKVSDLTEGDLRYSQGKRKRNTKDSLTVEEQDLIDIYRELPVQVQNTIKELCTLYSSAAR